MAGMRSAMRSPMRSALDQALGTAYMSLANQALAILRKFGTDAHVYLPGANGVAVSGLPTNNYTLSDGSTGYSAIDGTAGLVLDGAGSVGAELVTNGSFDSGLTGWTTAHSGAATVTVSGGTATWVTNGVDVARLRQSFVTEAGKMYRVSTAGTYSAFAIGTTAGGSELLTYVSGVERYFVATGATSWFNTASPANGVTLESVSIREVTGIHATQATTANKPALRRGSYNLLLNSVLAGGTSGTIGSGAVAPTGFVFPAGTGQVTFSGGTVRFMSAAQRPFLGESVALPVGSYVISARIEAGSSGRIDEVIGVSAGTATITGPSFKKNNVVVTALEPVSAGDVVAALFSVTIAGSPQIRVGLGCAGASTGDITMSSPQLEAGTTAGDYSPTTSAAASNQSAGRYSWQFDGSNDSLSLGSVPFQMSDDHCVIAGANFVGSSNGFVFSHGSGGVYPSLGDIFFDATGHPTVLWRDDANVTVSIAHASVMSGLSTVVAARKVGNAKALFVNGAQSGATNSTVQGVATITGTRIASYGAGGSLFTGQIGPIVAIKGTVSDADLLTLERWVASQTPNGPQF